MIYWIVFNWVVVILLVKDKDVIKMMYNFKKMGIVGVFVGMVIVVFLNSIVVVILELL